MNLYNIEKVIQCERKKIPSQNNFNVFIWFAREKSRRNYELWFPDMQNRERRKKIVYFLFLEIVSHARARVRQKNRIRYRKKRKSKERTKKIPKKFLFTHKSVVLFFFNSVRVCVYTILLSRFFVIFHLWSPSLSFSFIRCLRCGEC